MALDMYTDSPIYHPYVPLSHVFAKYLERFRFSFSVHLEIFVQFHIYCPKQLLELESP